MNQRKLRSFAARSFFLLCASALAVFAVAAPAGAPAASGTAATNGNAAAAAASAASPPGTPPHQVVKKASDVIQQMLLANRARYDADPERVHRMVDASLNTVVDYDGIAKSVMAATYRKATPAQRRRFATVFRTSLVRTYSRAMLQFVDFRIALLPVNPADVRPDRATVKMQAVGPDGQAYPMEYGMVKMPAGDWRIRNVTVNGVNLGLTYRNQFAQAMSAAENAGNIDKVIAGWTTSQVVPSNKGKPK